MLRNHYFSGGFLKPKFAILLQKLLVVGVDRFWLNITLVS